MTDLPILFSAPMVRAVIREIEQPGTGKTQTRRVLTPQPPADAGLVGIYAPRLTAVFGYITPDADCKIALRYVPGDRLYVREAWATEAAYDDLSPSAMGGEEPIRYDADGAHQTWGYPAISRLGRFRQGMHMPRWASRITLTVTEVRVQRLTEISDYDAIAEGIAGAPGQDFDIDGHWWPGQAPMRFRELWNNLNAERGYGWDANPWVVAVTFAPTLGNIDGLRP